MPQNPPDRRTTSSVLAFLQAWEIGAQAGVERRIALYNRQRPHTDHGGQPPAVVYVKIIETDRQVQAVA